MEAFEYKQSEAYWRELSAQRRLTGEERLKLRALGMEHVGFENEKLYPAPAQAPAFEKELYIFGNGTGRFGIVTHCWEMEEQGGVTTFEYRTDQKNGCP